MSRFTTPFLVAALVVSAAACSPPGEGSEAPAIANDGQCVEACPTCVGGDALVMLGTPDHARHRADAQGARDAARERGFTFVDANDLVPDGGRDADAAVAAIKSLPRPLTNLVVAIHGHGHRGGLTFNDGSQLSYADLFAAVGEADACSVFLSNDSCYSGSMFDAMPDAGLGRCLTVAASSSSGNTTSQCGNGLSREFTRRVIEGDAIGPSLSAAAATPGVLNNTSPGRSVTIANPACACGSDCLLGMGLGDENNRVDLHDAGTPGEDAGPSGESDAGWFSSPDDTSALPGGDDDACANQEPDVGFCDGDVLTFCFANGDRYTVDCPVEYEGAVCGDVAAPGEPAEFVCTDPEPTIDACGLPVGGACEGNTWLSCEGGETVAVGCGAGGADGRCVQDEAGAGCVALL